MRLKKNKISGFRPRVRLVEKSLGKQGYKMKPMKTHSQLNII